MNKRVNVRSNTRPLCAYYTPSTVVADADALALGRFRAEGPFKQALRRRAEAGSGLCEAGNAEQGELDFIG